MKLPVKSSLAILVVTIVALSGMLRGSVQQVPSGTWAATGGLNEARDGAAAVLMADGRVLVAGGEAGGDPLASVELYSATGTFSSASPMHLARRGHSTVALQDWRVLVTGGETIGEGVTNSVEIYDLFGNSWSLSSSMLEARVGHSATLLPDGRVLIVGDGNPSLEIFDPATDSFSYAGSLSSARSGHAAALLADGRVLIVGGSDDSGVLASCEIYDPASGEASAGPVMAVARAGHTATALLDGRVLVAGGSNGAEDLASAEIYDPAEGSWSTSASLAAPRRGHSAFLLPYNNNVLIVGGNSETAELYTPWTGSFSATGSPAAAHNGGAVSALDVDGLLLLAGGSGSASAELYGFATVKTDKDDYAPGETVVITGSGWQPGEEVQLLLHEHAEFHEDRILSATADENGDIFNNEFAPEDHDRGVRFYLTGTGASSDLSAQHSFTDGTISNASLTVGTSCGTSTASVSQGTALCARATYDVSGTGATNFSTRWYNPSDVQQQSTGGSHSSSTTLTGTTFDASFTVPATAPTGTWTVRFCQSAAIGAACVTQRASVTFTVTAACTSPSVTTNPSNQSVVVGETASFTAAASGSPAPSVQWQVSTDGGANFSNIGGATSTTLNVTPTSVSGFNGNKYRAVFTNTCTPSTATSSAATLTVSKASTTINITGDSPDPSVVGQAYTVTWSVSVDSPGAGTPTGTVTISGGSGCSAPVEDGQCDVTSTSAGAKTLTATYSGDDDFNGDSDTEDHDVDKADSEINITSDGPDSSVVGESYTVTWTVDVVAPGAGTPTGTVTVDDGDGNDCSAPVEDGQCDVTSTSAGAKTLTATYSGEDDFNGDSDTEDHDVDKADTEINITSDDPDSSVVGESYTVEWTVDVVAPGAGTPTGTVTVDDGDGNDCSAPVADGQCDVTSTSAGAKTLTATYSGDDNFNGDSDTEDHDVDKADTTITIDSDLPDPSVVGQSYTVTWSVDVVAPGAGTPTGTVTVSGGSGCSAPVEDGQCDVTSTTAGSKSLTAGYSGDDNFNDSESEVESHQVDPADTSVSLVSDNDPSEFGEAVTFTATVSVDSPGAGSPTGTITFYASGSCSGTILAGPTAIDGSFQASFPTSALTAADSPHDITACYSGDVDFNASDDTLSQVVDPAQVTETVTVTPSTQQYSDLVTFEATLSQTSINGLAPATSVTFYVGTQNMGTVSLVVDGGVLKGTLADVALLEPVPFGTAPTGQMAPGVRTVKAVFGGVDPNFDVDDATTSLTITKEDARATYTGATFASTSCATCSSATVTLAATVQDISATTDAGSDDDPGDIRNATVSFVNRDAADAVLCTASVGLVSAADTTTGTATCNVSINLGIANSVSITVGVVVNNYYTRNSSGDDTVVTVSKPLNDFITGGGYLVLESSAGLAAGAPGKKNNFGFNVKYNKSGKNLQGNINTIIRSTTWSGVCPVQASGIYVYQVKGNAMTSLSANKTTGTAIFNGKANIRDITDPLNPCAVDGNASLQVTMDDNGEPGRYDTIGITVWNKNGGMWFSSRWNGVQTVEQVLGGGNLVVH